MPVSSEFNAYSSSSPQSCRFFCRFDTNATSLKAASCHCNRLMSLVIQAASFSPSSPKQADPDATCRKYSKAPNCKCPVNSLVIIYQLPCEHRPDNMAHIIWPVWHAKWSYNGRLFDCVREQAPGCASPMHMCTKEALYDKGMASSTRRDGVPGSSSAQTKAAPAHAVVTRTPRHGP